ncbi:MAG: hypothetical protein K6G28_03065, partial [Acholeplasmatales bacterium]|nr:hypothetical protein [Acholeplasmatales bacterium]
MKKLNDQTLVMVKSVLEKNAREEKEKSCDADIVGSEIKIKRAKMKVTLKALTSDICSVSYLSKVEHNKIKANNQVLHEICNRLEISKEQLNEMLKSGGTFKELLKAFYEQDLHNIDLIYFKVVELKNYRAQIIKCFYYLAHNNLKEYERISKLILPSLSTLNNYDANHYCLSLMVYYFLSNQIKECAQTLNSLIEVFNSDVEGLIVKEYQIKVASLINSSFTLSYIDDYKSRCAQINYLNGILRAEEIRKTYLNQVIFANLWNKFPQSEVYEFNNINYLLKSMDDSDADIYKNLLAYYTDKESLINNFNNNELSFKSNLDYYLVNYLVTKETYYDKAINYL